MVGVIIQSTGSYRLGLAALGVQSVLGALILLRWRGADKASAAQLASVTR
jgi:hypothetical protein